MFKQKYFLNEDKTGPFYQQKTTLTLIAQIQSAVHAEFSELHCYGKRGRR